MIGYVAIGLGPGHDGGDSVAVWHVGLDGTHTGAWLLPPSSAAHLPALCSDRSLAAWDPTRTVQLLREHTGFTPPHCTSIRLLLNEVLTTRRSLVDSPQWSYVVPDPLPETATAFRRVVGLARPDDACPSATRALTTARMLTWAIAAHRETPAPRDVMSTHAASGVQHT
ncbi:DUF6218 family protein [Allokutzneria sp. NRRL B-24872]|uniref:DUF6218 family protein n=1 Tax=Allokutzneria sp. NRRL B-24872 TaxID=1137961 RepID=UPI000A397D95|nr:DUF6218 family protein [Allokutzneria sp. NRRL B-24872]